MLAVGADGIGKTFIIDEIYTRLPGCLMGLQSGQFFHKKDLAYCCATLPNSDMSASIAGAFSWLASGGVIMQNLDRAIAHSEPAC